MDLGSVSNVKTKNSCVVHVLQPFRVTMQNSDVEKKKRVKVEKTEINAKIERS